MEQDEPVAFLAGQVASAAAGEPELSAEEDREQVGGLQALADVSLALALGHAHDPLADPVRGGREIRDVGSRRTGSRASLSHQMTCSYGEYPYETIPGQ